MYTVVYYTGRQVHLFPASSLQEAYQCLRTQTRPGLGSREEEIRAIVAGCDDELIYFDQPHSLYKRLTDLIGYLSRL